MPFLKILYGPYEAYGVIKHRFQKVRGLYDCLTALGYEIELIETNLLNRLSIELWRKKVFSCDIRNLMFNLECEDDTVCQRAIATVTEAENRFDNDMNMIRKTSVIKGKKETEDLQKMKVTTTDFDQS